MASSLQRNSTRGEARNFALMSWKAAAPAFAFARSSTAGLGSPAEMMPRCLPEHDLDSLHSSANDD
eukprot:10859721-Lingulodinium_polyedra.AAC.1